MLSKVIKNKNPNLSWESVMNDIESMQRQIEAKDRISKALKKRFSLSQNSKILESRPTSDEKRLTKELRMPCHTIQGLSHDNVKAKKTLEIIRLFQRAAKLAMVVSGANDTELENKTLKFGSPRLLSQIPNNVKNEINVLSPSLLSIRDKGGGLEALTSIPRLLEAFDNKGYREWLNFIVEASGTTDVVDKMFMFCLLRHVLFPRMILQLK